MIPRQEAKIIEKSILHIQVKKRANFFGVLKRSLYLCQQLHQQSYPNVFVNKLLVVARLKIQNIVRR